MQAIEEDSCLHSCFDSLKHAVMGCCYSICQKENDIQENPINERTRLLEVPEQQQETPTTTASASTPPRKSDENAAMNQILTQHAAAVIDVSALGGYTLEPGVYSERVRAYTARVASLPPATPLPSQRLLRDVSLAERNTLLSQSELPKEDRDLLANYVKKAAAAISELRVEHHEDLVVPFRVP